MHVVGTGVKTGVGGSGEEGDGRFAADGGSQSMLASTSAHKARIPPTPSTPRAGTGPDGGGAGRGRADGGQEREERFHVAHGSTGVGTGGEYPRPGAAPPGQTDGPPAPGYNVSRRPPGRPPTTGEP